MSPAAWRLRPLRGDDAAAVLALNDAWEHFTSPLDAASLERLVAQVAQALVAERGGEVVAFALALREGAPYASPNYRWFDARYTRFVYVDRVVVAAGEQRRGIGRGLYDEVIAAARQQQVPRVVCEIDATNEPSARFHDRFGFEEVARERPGDGCKVVSFRALELGPRP